MNFIVICQLDWEIINIFGPEGADEVYKMEKKENECSQ